MNMEQWAEVGMYWFGGVSMLSLAWTVLCVWRWVKLARRERRRWLTNRV